VTGGPQCRRKGGEAGDRRSSLFLVPPAVAPIFQIANFVACAIFFSEILLKPKIDSTRIKLEIKNEFVETS